MGRTRKIFDDKRRGVIRIQAADGKKGIWIDPREESVFIPEQVVTRPAVAKINRWLNVGPRTRFICAVEDALKTRFSHKYNFPLAAAIKDMLQQFLPDNQSGIAEDYAEVIKRQCKAKLFSLANLVLTEKGIATLNWFENSVRKGVEWYTDPVYLLLYNDSTGKILFAGQVAERLDQEVKFECPRAKRRDRLYGWIFFKEEELQYVHS